MNTGRSVFSQIMDFLPLAEFRRCVKSYRGHYKVQSFSCLDQFLCMAFAQLTYRESLRDIETCLRSMPKRLYHMGIRGTVSHSTLAHANRRRDWRIYADFAQVLIHQARQLYADEEFGVELAETVYALNATTIDLCLSLFPWAWFQRRKAGIKLHTILDLRGSIPTFIKITDARAYEVCLLDELIPEPGSFYIMDRAFVDFKRLYTLHLCQANFVVRSRANLQFRRRYSRPVENGSGVKCDQIIILTGQHTPLYYPDKLRRVRFLDPETQNDLTFLTNNFILPAEMIAQLYKCRWQIELFFKWIKQHLRIKSFYGTSENAVKTQIWIAVSVYLLVAILKKRLKLDISLYTLLQILSVTLFEKVSLFQVVTDFNRTSQSPQSCNQLQLFNL
jgi:hypothetical protein